MEREPNAQEEPSTDAPVSSGGEPQKDDERHPDEADKKHQDEADKKHQDEADKKHQDELVDEASDESFPASDPPAF